jgi:two-component system cell cycle response regulator
MFPAKESLLSLPNNSIIDEIKASGRLPSPTGVALTILELTRDPNVNIEEMAKVLHGDPSLSGQIIKYANSAAAGNRNPVASINDALVRLGMSMVRQLCLGFSVLSNTQTGKCENFDYDGFWARSLAMASSCQTLARTMGGVNTDEGFTCGLLCEVGGLALASVYPEAYYNVLEAWQNGTRADLLRLEKEKLLIDRNQVTAALFEDWRLPEFYSKAVLNKDKTDWDSMSKPPQGSESCSELANLLFIGRLAAEICMESDKERHWRVLEFTNFARMFSLGDEDLANVYDEILTEWSRMGKVLDVVTGQVPSMSKMLRSARASRGDDNDFLPEGVIDSRHESVETEIVPAEIEGFDLGGDTVRGIRILVATDCPLHQKILTKKLTAAGHEVTVAKDGSKALEIAVATSPQLVISDWMMPGMDGLELCRTLRLSPHLSHIHFIIMTIHDSNEELVEAFEAGINYYLVKPLNHSILAALLRGAAREIATNEEVQRQQVELRRTNAEINITNRMLKTMALEDQLTKLPNRRAGLDGLDKAWAKSTRSEEPLLVMILDIDFFKKVNDNYGHDAGDAVLRATAVAMKDAIRDSDEICRFGGEEFLVVCPGADVDVAAMVGNRIRKAVENNHLDTPEFTGNVTISIGAAVRRQSTPDTLSLVKQADEALYAAKDAGRNKVCIFDPERAAV